MKNIFENNLKTNAPLYERMRPYTLSSFIGQKHLIDNGKLLHRAISSHMLGSCIFYGPPGTGKTTLASIIANDDHAEFIRLNAVTCGVSEAKEAISIGKQNLELYGKKTYLLLDECHRWKKSQSDSVLEAIEKGYIIFIGSTTENPHISMTPAIVSRCRIFEFYRLSHIDIQDSLINAVYDKDNGYGNINIDISTDAVHHIAYAANGDMRKALGALELAVLTTPMTDDKIVIDIDTAVECIQSSTISVDDSMYYDLLSAFCKSLRGSDPDAALYYSQRLITAGCDPMLICRRLIVHASEDVGMADSNALLLSSYAQNAMMTIGMPEANIPLCHAIIYVSLCPKSNSVIKAMNEAINDAKYHPDDNIPKYLKDKTYNNKDDKLNYKYPHDYGGYVRQQYLPDTLKERHYYIPSNNGKEKNILIPKSVDKK